MTERDSHGKFIRGHTPVTMRDKTTGRFLPKQEPMIQLIIPAEPAPAPAETPEVKPVKKEDTVIKNRVLFLKQPKDW